jgi:hypothetical protein
MTIDLILLFKIYLLIYKKKIKNQNKLVKYHKKIK